MTPEEAIKFIEQVRKQVPMNGDMHDQFRIALMTIIKVVGEKTAAPKDVQKPTV